MQTRKYAYTGAQCKTYYLGGLWSTVSVKSHWDEEWSSEDPERVKGHLVGDCNSAARGEATLTPRSSGRGWRNWEGALTRLDGSLGSAGRAESELRDTGAGVLSQPAHSEAGLTGGGPSSSSPSSSPCTASFPFTHLCPWAPAGVCPGPASGQGAV